MLKVENLVAGYGAIEALHGVSLSVQAGEIVTLIGCNGAGKSTLLRSISALIPATRGSIVFDGHDITRMLPHLIVKKGIAHVPEGRGVFAEMTVYENLQLGHQLRTDTHQFEADFAHVFSLFPILKERQKQKAGTLSGGEQQMLALSRALMARPRMLLLDEPSLGLAPLIVQTIFSIIKKINEDGTTVLLIEQNAHQALKLAHRGYVIDTGSIVLEDTGSNLLKSEKVRKAYLGEL
ncbi:MAG: ABC transporter ATP-binding protein [Verrucomicrobiota bacterium]|nr:ABC transporter ATP-binding protein [Verrucomicrobiota bacterium]